jgi:transposase
MTSPIKTSNSSPRRRKNDLRSSNTIKRVVRKHEEDYDGFQNFIHSLEVKRTTALNWVQQYRGRLHEVQMRKKRGGKKEGSVKLNEQHIDAIAEYLEDNPLITLRELSDNIKRDFDISVHPSTIDKRIRGLFTLKKKSTIVPENMNSLVNKEKRKEYVIKVQDLLRQRDTRVIFLDECNFNLFCSRSEGRSRVGERCVIRGPASKGQNIHCIGLMSQFGIEKLEVRRGSFTAQAAAQLIEDFVTVWIAANPHLNLCIVIDNAPAHARIDEIVGRHLRLTVLRLAPYSYLLNPIEMLWSALKAGVKRFLSGNMVEILDNSNLNGLTMKEARLRRLEEAIQSGISSIVMHDCLHYVQHVSKHYRGCELLHDIRD